MTIRVVQALRGLAALLVVSVHVGNPNGFEAKYLATSTPLLGPVAKLGSIGVDLFFVISGFIMVVSSVRPEGKSLAPLEFLRRRFVRVYPAVWIVNALVLVVYLSHPALVNAHSAERPDVLASFLLLPQSGAPLVLVTWTLVFEMYFYLVFAVALLNEARFMSTVLALWGVAIIVMSLTLTHVHGPYATYLARPIAFEFLIGAAVGGVAMRKDVSFRASMAALGVGGCVLVVCVLGVLSGALAYPDGWARVLLSVPIALTMFGLIALERRRGPYVPRAAERIGDASFAMYLLHVPLLTVIGLAVERLHLSGRAADVVSVVLAYASTVLVGYAFFVYVERPLTRFLRHGVRRRRAEIAI